MLLVAGSDVEDVVRRAVADLRVGFVAKPFDDTVLAEEVTALFPTTM